MKYNLNILRLIYHLMLVALRKTPATTHLLQLLLVLTAPIKTIHNRLLSFRTQSCESLTYNAQYPNLQRLLNDKFDGVQRRIKAYDGLHINWVVVHPLVDQVPVVTPLVINSAYSYALNTFIVELPQQIFNTQDLINQIKSLVNNHKFAGTNYKIIKN